MGFMDRFRDPAQQPEDAAQPPTGETAASSDAAGGKEVEFQAEVFAP